MFRHKGGVGLSRDDAPFPSSVCVVYEPTVKGKSRTVLGISKKKLPVSEKKIFFVGAHVLLSFFFLDDSSVFVWFLLLLLSGSRDDTLMFFFPLYILLSHFHRKLNETRNACFMFISMTK